MADPFPLYLPPDVRRLFQTESMLRRLVQTAQWAKGPKLLELFGSLGALALSRAVDAQLTIVEPEQKAIDHLKERVKVAKMEDKVTFLHKPVMELSFEPQSFDGVISMGRVLGPLGETAGSLRRLLKPRGRIAITGVLKVGKNPAKASLDFWEARIGQPLPLPREALMAVESAGYEPELLESLSESELDEFYKEVEVALKKVDAADPRRTALEQEIEVHRAQGGRSGVTLGLVIARRKEPGEKPPLSRDSG